ncbi:MAG: hypothetical protein IJQ74_06225 [Synergistaceae bacterium]|nr:hypothetical protein [Synergistaceae bacterium]
MIRKTIMAALLLMLMTNSCYGAVSEDIYVRKDVFDAKMEAFMAEIRLMNEQLRGEIRELSSRINGVEKRMSTLEIMIYWILGTLSVAFAVLALAPYLKEIRKPSITLNDVRRLDD